MDHTPIWQTQIIYHPNDGEAVRVGARAFPSRAALEEWLGSLPALGNSDYLCLGESPNWIDPTTGAKGLRYDPVFVPYEVIKDDIEQSGPEALASRDSLENRDRLIRSVFDSDWFYKVLTLVGLMVLLLVGASTKAAELLKTILELLGRVIPRLP
jgi:hypothetical protein